MLAGILPPSFQGEMSAFARSRCVRGGRALLPFHAASGRAGGSNMNTVGKVLVILNLVFALATGGFLAVDLVYRTNWRTHAEGCQRELEVARANTAAMKKTFEELDRQAKN